MASFVWGRGSVLMHLSTWICRVEEMWLALGRGQCVNASIHRMNSHVDVSETVIYLFLLYFYQCSAVM